MSPSTTALPGTFHRLWSASLASNLADGVGMVVMPLLAMRLSDDPFVVSVVTALTFLPWLLLGVLSGAVVDRSDRRRVMGFGALARAGAYVALAIVAATVGIPLWLLFATVLLAACIETLADGAAQAMVPTLVPGARLDTANSRFQAGELVMQGMVALPLGAALFSLAVPLPMVVGAIAYVAAAVLVLTLPRRAGRPAPVEPTAAASREEAPDGQPEDARESIWAATGAGLRYTFGHRDLRGLVLVTAAIALTMHFAQGALMFYLVRGVGVPEAALGLLTAGMALGGVAGAIGAPALARRLGRRRVMVGGTGVAGAAFIALALVPRGTAGVLAAAVAMAVAAMAATVWNVQSSTVRQLIVPGVMLGRVNGATRTLVWGLAPVGALLGGLVSRVDLRLPLLVGGALAVVAAVVAAPQLAFVDKVIASDDEPEPALAPEPQLVVAPEAQPGLVPDAEDVDPRAEGDGVLAQR
jgi:Na+/melibiose symporter-like transporter